MAHGISLDLVDKVLSWREAEHARDMQLHYEESSVQKRFLEALVSWSPGTSERARMEGAPSEPGTSVGRCSIWLEGYVPASAGWIRVRGVRLFVGPACLGDFAHGG